MKVTKQSDRNKQKPIDLRRQANTAKFRYLFMQKVIRNPIFIVFLLVLILAIFIFQFVKIHNERNSLRKDKTELINQFKIQSDSIQLKNIKFSAVVFSWSVRNEMLRNNMDNLNLMLNYYARESGADLVQLISEKDKTILISSDKKFEGGKFNDPIYMDLNKPVIVNDTLKTTVYTPILGLNQKIGLLKIDLLKR